MSRMVFDAPPSAPRRRGRPLPPLCADPNCDEPHAEGSRFCSAHRDRLAVIREAFDARTGRNWMRDSFGRKGGGARRGGGQPVCCAPGCFELHESGHAYCPSCEAAGFTEEED